MDGMLIPLLLGAISAADLTPETAPRLKVAWTYHTKATPPDERSAKIAAFETTPLLAGKLLYVVTPFNQVIALDPGTGAERWRYDPHIAKNRGYSEASARGVAVADGHLFFGTLDGRLIAIDATSGKLLWEAPLDPKVADGLSGRRV